MNINFDRAGIVLAPRQRLLLEDAAGTRIVCRTGIAWITQYRDLRDIVLRRGDSFVLDRPGLAIVQAERETTLALSEPVRDDRAARRFLPWWAQRYPHIAAGEPGRQILAAMHGA